MGLVIGEATITIDGEEVSIADFLKQQNVEFEEVEDNSNLEGEDKGERVVGPNGFPENTPVKDMTDAEQAAYYKYHNRKAEQRLRDSQSKTGKTDDAAVEAAKSAGLAAGLTVAAKSELARRLSVEPDALEPVLSLFGEGVLVKDGKVDEDALAGVVSAFTTIKGGVTPPVEDEDKKGLTPEQIAAMGEFGSQGIPKGNKGGSVRAAQAAEESRMETFNNK